MKYAIWFFIVCLSMVLIGCASPILNLSGDSSSGASRNVVLSYQKVASGLETHIFNIDQTKIRIDMFGKPSEIHLSPGHHTVSIGFLKVKFLGGMISSAGAQIVEFDAEAGHHYEARVTFSEEGGDFRWDAEIVDLDTGKKFMPR